MYQKILVTLDTTKADQTILEHIRPLVRLCGGRLVLMHVANGWAAQRFGSEAISPEVAADSAYLARLKRELEREGLRVETYLAYGDPATEIIKYVTEQGCDLVAMATHGHRLLMDLLLGTTAAQVQHGVNVPVLAIRAKCEAQCGPEARPGQPESQALTHG